MGLIEVIIDALQGALQAGMTALSGEFGNLLKDMSLVILSTPHPVPDGQLFALEAPTSGLWIELYPVYQDFQMVALLGFTLALGMVFTSGTWRKSAETRQNLRTLTLYFFITLSWWWIGGAFLKGTYLFTKAIIGAPELSGLSGLMSVGAGGIVLTAMIYIAGWAAAGFAVVVYVARWLLIHIFHTFMPILFLLKAFPEDRISGFADRLIGIYPGIVLTTIPVAGVLRIGIAIADSEYLGGWLGPAAAIAILSIAILIPKYTMQFSSSLRRTARKGSDVIKGSSTAGRAELKSKAANALGMNTTAAKAGSEQSKLNSAEASHLNEQGSEISPDGLSDDPTTHSADYDFSGRRGRRHRQKAGARMMKAAMNPRDTLSKKKEAARTAGSALRDSSGLLRDKTESGADSINEKLNSASEGLFGLRDRVEGRFTSDREERTKKRSRANQLPVNSTVEAAREAGGDGTFPGEEGDTALNGDVPGEGASTLGGDVDTTGGSDVIVEDGPTAGSSRDLSDDEIESGVSDFIDDVDNVDEVDEQDVRSAAHEYTDTDIGEQGSKTAEDDEFGFYEEFQEQTGRDMGVFLGGESETDASGEIDPIDDIVSRGGGVSSEGGTDTDEEIADISSDELISGSGSGLPSSGNDDGGNSPSGGDSESRSELGSNSDPSGLPLEDSQESGGQESGNSDLTEAEQAVDEYFETHRDKSLEEASDVEVAADVMSEDDRVSKPQDAIDAIDSLKDKRDSIDKDRK